MILKWFSPEIGFTINISDTFTISDEFVLKSKQRWQLICRIEQEYENLWNILYYFYSFSIIKDHLNNKL